MARERAEIRLFALDQSAARRRTIFLGDPQEPEARQWPAIQQPR
jgi:hypothetical protein